jgi:hypothetical protein
LPIRFLETLTCHIMKGVNIWYTLQASGTSYYDVLGFILGNQGARGRVVG